MRFSYLDPRVFQALIHSHAASENTGMITIRIISSPTFGKNLLITICKTSIVPNYSEKLQKRGKFLDIGVLAVHGQQRVDPSAGIRTAFLRYNSNASS